MITRTFELVHPDAPKSLNAGGTGSRRHWSVGYREKKKWAEVYFGLLLLEKVPRAMTSCHVEAEIHWKRKARRDVENYRSSISKPFADVLVTGAWLPDDTDEFFTFGQLKFEYPKPWTSLLGTAEVHLHLTACYPQASRDGEAGLGAR